MISSVGQNFSPQTRLEILISNYNLLNSYSLVVHPVGLHCNYFESEESLENMVLLVNETRTETCGRQLWGQTMLLGSGHPRTNPTPWPPAAPQSCLTLHPQSINLHLAPCHKWAICQPWQHLLPLDPPGPVHHAGNYHPCPPHCVYHHYMLPLHLTHSNKKGHYMYTMMPYTSCIPVKNGHFWSCTETYTVHSVDFSIIIPSVN